MIDTLLKVSAIKVPIGTLKKVYACGTMPSILHFYALTSLDPIFGGFCLQILQSTIY